MTGISEASRPAATKPSSRRARQRIAFRRSDARVQRHHYPHRHERDEHQRRAERSGVTSRRGVEHQQDTGRPGRAGQAARPCTRPNPTPGRAASTRPRLPPPRTSPQPLNASGRSAIATDPRTLSSTAAGDESGLMGVADAHPPRKVLEHPQRRRRRGGVARCRDDRQREACPQRGQLRRLDGDQQRRHDQSAANGEYR